MPIEVDEEGNTLDGHHRLRAFGELRAEGVEVPDYKTIIRVGLTEGEKRCHIRALNLLRRHLTREQLAEQMRQMRRDGAKLEEIARAAAVSVFTAHAVTQGVNLENKNQPETITNTRGQKRPTHYRPRQRPTVIARTRRALNLLRRHLTREQRDEQMRQMRRDGAKLEEIARAAGVSVGVAHEATKTELFKNEKLVGKDGKSYPTHYRPRPAAPRFLLPTGPSPKQEAREDPEYNWYQLLVKLRPFVKAIEEG